MSETIKSLINNLVIRTCNNVFILNLGLIEAENNTYQGYDGVLVVNPWNLMDNIKNTGGVDNRQTVYPIKNGIYEKWRSEGGCLSPIGVPKSEELSPRPNTWNQLFTRGFEGVIHKNNSIEAYVNNLLWPVYKFESFYVVNKVADSYAADGRSSSKRFLYPIQDTQKEGDKKFCKQQFMFATIDRCSNLTGIGIELPFTTQNTNPQGWNSNNIIHNSTIPNQRESQFKVHQLAAGDSVNTSSNK